MKRLAAVVAFLCLFCAAALASETPYIARHGVNFSTGNKYLSERDASFSDPTGSSSFVRNYNSQSKQDDIFGYGWSIEGLERLEFDLDIGLITRYRGDGQKSLFWAPEDDAAPGQWVNPVGEQKRITALARDEGYQLHLPKGEVRHFNKQGQIIFRRSLDSRETRYAWDDEGRLTSITGPFGWQMALSYNDDGLVRQLNTAMGTFTYSYDENRNLISVTRPDNTTRVYVYEDEFDVHNLTAVLDETGKRIQTISYDSQDRVISSAFADDREKITIAYQTNYKRSITNSLGNVTTYQLESIHGTARVKSIIGPACASGCGGISSSIKTSYTYNFQQQVESATDGRGTITRYGYDEQGRKITETKAAGTALERVTRTSWTDSGEVASITEASLAPEKEKITSYSYDSGGRMLGQTISGWRGETAISATTTYTYDALGRLLTINGPRSGAGDVTTLSWYPDEASQGNNRGQLHTITNALGHVISYDQYTPCGRPSLVTDANGLQATLNYNLRGQLISSASNNLITRYERDAAGRLLSITLPGGKRITYSYNDADQVERIADQAGNALVFVYDTEGRVISRALLGPDQNVTASMAVAYDSYGRLSQLIPPEGGIEKIAYDANGNLLSRINGLNQSSTFSYDAFNRLISAKNPAGEQAGYGYDPQDNQASVTDPRGLVTTYTYDDLGNQIQTISPDTGTTLADYDEAGNLISATDANGLTTSYSYDALNRPVSITYSGTDRSVQISYDQGTNSIGRLSAITDNSGQSQYRYDIFGRLIEEISQINGKSFQVGYAYDDNGDLSAITYPSGRIISYQRDADGRVTGLVSTQANQSTALAQGISYAPFGPLQSMTLGNGVQIQASHDQQYRLSSLEAGAVLKREYSYTLLSQVAAISDELDASRSQSFVYDLSGRLSQAQGVYGTFSYSYDPNGNRLSKTEDGTSTSYQYGTSNNRLLGVGNGPILSYDAKGRLTEEGERNYSWDEDDRLSAISENNAATLGQYGYDVFGLRRSAARASGTNFFIYDSDGNLLAETDVNGVVLREYVYLDDQRLALFGVSNSDAVFYYINDHLGTAQILLDNQGTVVWQGNYRPFGKVDVVVNNLEQYFRFPGQIFEVESGLHYNWNRYYNPETGRYISPDPIGLSSGLNLYAYVANNPVNRVDPWGLQYDNLFPKINPTHIYTPYRDENGNWVFKLPTHTRWNNWGNWEHYSTKTEGGEYPAFWLNVRCICKREQCGEKIDTELNVRIPVKKIQFKEMLGGIRFNEAAANMLCDEKCKSLNQ